MIRFIVIVLTLVVFLIGSIPILLVETVIGHFNKPLMHRSCQKMVQWIFRLILRESGADITVIGRENIPADRAVLYVSNHRSYFDILLAYTNISAPCTFIAKKEFTHIPLLSSWMRKLSCQFLDRDDPKAGLNMILQAADAVKNGMSIHICPEGTRNHGEEMLPFKSGSLKIAEKSNCPIVPIAVLNTDEIYENHRPFIHPAKVSIWFGEPVYTENMERSEKKHLGPMTQAVIADMIQQMKNGQPS